MKIRNVKIWAQYLAFYLCICPFIFNKVALHTYHHIPHRIIILLCSKLALCCITHITNGQLLVEHQRRLSADKKGRQDIGIERERERDELASFDSAGSKITTPRNYFQLTVL